MRAKSSHGARRGGVLTRRCDASWNGFRIGAMVKSAAVPMTFRLLELAVERVERFRPFVRMDHLNHRLVFCRVTDDAHWIFAALDAVHVLVEQFAIEGNASIR